MDIPQTARSYTACLVSLMSFVDGVDYDTSASFSKEQLLAITANQVAAYLNLKAYGTPTPGPSDRPIHGRSNSLAFQKEDILGLSGIFKAGDALDGDVMNQFIAKHLGSRFQYTLPGSENILTFPRQLLKKICSPAHITHLKERETWEHLQHIQKPRKHFQ